MIEKDFDVPFVAQLAQREKQMQQYYRPVIGVHKWFARRPGTLFRALLLAEFGDEQPLADRFFSSHDLSRLIVGDPLMGDGTPLESHPNLNRKRIERWVREFAQLLEIREVWDDITPWLQLPDK